MFELENGLNRLFRDQFEAIVMKRDEVIKVVVCFPKEQVSGLPERARPFLTGDWMGWKELEEKEAEIVTRAFEHGIRF